MCLIICKPKGIPVSDTLFNSILNGWACNHDGAGFAYKRNGGKVITLDKGYFERTTMESKIKSLNIGENDELIVHLRMCTHGARNTTNTHPFVIHKDKINLLNADGFFAVLAHNGCVPHFFEEGEESDTYMCAKWIAEAVERKEYFERSPVELIKGCKYMANQKFSVLTPDNDLITYGSFFKDKEGYLYSNYMFQGANDRSICTVFNKKEKSSSVKTKSIKDLVESVSFYVPKDSRTPNFSMIIPEDFIKETKSFLGIKETTLDDKSGEKEKFLRKDLMELVNKNLLFIDKNNMEDFELVVKKDNFSDDKIGQKAYINGVTKTPSNRSFDIKREKGVNHSVYEHILDSYFAQNYFLFAKFKYDEDYNDYYDLVNKIGFTKKAYKSISTLYESKYKDKEPIMFVSLAKGVSIAVTKRSVRMYLMNAPEALKLKDKELVTLPKEELKEETRTSVEKTTETGKGDPEILNKETPAPGVELENPLWQEGFACM